MKPLHKGLMIAAVHLLIVLSIGGKLLYDRATCPRIWVRANSYDPDLPIRGRYFALNLQVHPADLETSSDHRYVSGYESGEVTLSVEDKQIVAHKANHSTGMYIQSRGRADQYVLAPPSLFFLSEHADTPRVSGAELWVEVTVPKNGPPRPIQLALKRGSEWTPLTYR